MDHERYFRLHSRREERDFARLVRHCCRNHRTETNTFSFLFFAAAFDASDAPLAAHVFDSDKRENEAGDVSIASIQFCAVSTAEIALM